jgi:drug/metabolite transporter (DMT)-like permease
MSQRSDGSHPARILIAYLSVFIVWGSTYLAIRIGVRDFPPALMAGVRFLISGSLLLLAGKMRRQPFPLTLKEYWNLSIVGLFLLVGGNGLVVWSEQWVPSGLAALIIATVPLFMSTIDALIPGGHRLSLVGWLGIVIGFSGVIVLVSPGLGLAAGEAIEPRGIAGLVGASFLWSVGSIYARRNPVRGDIFVNVGVEMLAGGFALSLLALASGELMHVRVTEAGILSVLYLIIFGSIVGFTAYGYLLRHVPPAKASTYAYVNPIVAVLLGALVLAEPLEGRTILATVIILGGVGIVQVARVRSM